MSAVLTPSVKNLFIQRLCLWHSIALWQQKEGAHEYNFLFMYIFLPFPLSYVQVLIRYFIHRICFEGNER